MSDTNQITSSDIEAKFGQLKTELENAAGAARGTATKIGLVAGTLIVIIAFLLGSRRGKRGKTVVELRRL